MQEKENRKLKIVIVILSVLLALSLLLLAGTLIYGRISETRYFGFGADLKRRVGSE